MNKRERIMKKNLLQAVIIFFDLSILIAGINFNVTKAVSHGSSGTPVGGIIWENTTWTLENSPYIITDTVQIPENVTLTIEPGVTVKRPTSGDIFLLHGTVYAHGTINNKIVFDGGGNSEFFTTWGGEGSAYLDYCIIRNGSRFWNRGGHFNLTHSELINLTGNIQLESPSADICIEYNKFVNTGGLNAYQAAGRFCKIQVRYNLFQNTSSSIHNSGGSPGQNEMIVKYNSFIDIDGIILSLTLDFDTAVMDATENYWGTLDTDVIDSKIYDRNDDIRIKNYIDYLPILTEPHPDTPIMLEDVKVDISGIFRKDDDGKWRCYANITIRNNSYKNVTIQWIYLNAINITYVDKTFEELNISGNETLNYVIQPEQEFPIGWTIAEFGFTKEPKILWVLFKTPVPEAYGTITLTTAIPEFPSAIILPLFMMLTLLIVVLAKRKLLRKRTH